MYLAFSVSIVLRFGQLVLVESAMAGTDPPPLPRSCTTGSPSSSSMAATLGRLLDLLVAAVIDDGPPRVLDEPSLLRLAIDAPATVEANVTDAPEGAPRALDGKGAKVRVGTGRACLEPPPVAILMSDMFHMDKSGHAY